MGGHRKLQLNELNKLRDQAYENSLIYKEETKKIHDSKIKNRIFNVGDQVLLFNSRLKIFSRKLKTRWSGPFTITKVFPYGTVELSQLDGPNFKVRILQKPQENQTKNGHENGKSSGSLSSNTVANSRGDVKAITTRSGVAYDGLAIPPTPSPIPKEVECETEVTKDKVQNTSPESTEHVQPLVV
nr:reverse transcriptase domain-containing protein [Tanacetum cinerariifolium]